MTKQAEEMENVIMRTRVAFSTLPCSMVREKVYELIEAIERIRDKGENECQCDDMVEDLKYGLKWVENNRLEYLADSVLLAYNMLKLVSFAGWKGPSREATMRAFEFTCENDCGFTGYIRCKTKIVPTMCPFCGGHLVQAEEIRESAIP
jgi:hypothetical protein